MFGIGGCCGLRRIYLPAQFLNGGYKWILLDVQGEVVAVPRSVTGVAAGTVIQCRPSLIVGRTPTRGGRPSRRPASLLARAPMARARLNQSAISSRRRPH